MENTADTIDVIKLDNVTYAPSARHAEEKGCLPGTQESVLWDICDMLNNPNQDTPQVCLLTGVTGSGKSVIAYSIARLYDKQERLGSSYCFSSSDMVSRNPKNLSLPLHADLANKDHQYKSALWKIIKGNQALHTLPSPSE